MEEVLYRRHIDEVLYRDILDPQDRPSKESRLRLSLGHEIGHWRLHRHYLAYDPAPIVCQTSCGPKKRVESQADHFASCLLCRSQIGSSNVASVSETRIVIFHRITTCGPTRFFVISPPSRAVRAIGIKRYLRTSSGPLRTCSGYLPQP